METNSMMQYSLGPILFYWPLDKVEHFYQQAALSNADIVYLGETVCSKRRAVKNSQWISMAQDIAATGKQVALSTMALLEAPSELKVLKKAIDNGDFIVEVNDFAGVEQAYQAKVPFVCGPALNIYNGSALKLLQEQGMQRWVMPVELSRDWLININQEMDELNIRDKIEVEVFAYGHLPLAYSARCFTAQSEGKNKDNCDTCCIKYPQGRQVHSQEDQSLFVLNGIQTLSGECYDLINDQASMQGLVDVVRISPIDESSIKYLSKFKAQATAANPTASPNTINGYWHQLAGIYQSEE